MDPNIALSDSGNVILGWQNGEGAIQVKWEYVHSAPGGKPQVSSAEGSDLACPAPCSLGEDAYDSTIPKDASGLSPKLAGMALNIDNDSGEGTRIEAKERVTCHLAVSPKSNALANSAVE